MMLIVEAAVRKRDPGDDGFDFWRALIEQEREDGKVDQVEWTGLLTRMSGDPSLGADLLRLADEGVADPAAFFASLFERAGVPHERDAAGRLRLR
jgi:hypothetical protein